MQLAAVAEPRVDEIEDHGVGGGEPHVIVAEEEREQELGGVVAVARVEAGFFVEHADDALLLFCRNLLLFECCPLRYFAADDAEHRWLDAAVSIGAVAVATVGGGGGAARVLGLEDWA